MKRIVVFLVLCVALACTAIAADAAPQWDKRASHSGAQGIHDLRNPRRAASEPRPQCACKGIAGEGLVPLVCLRDRRGRQPAVHGRRQHAHREAGPQQTRPATAAPR